MTSSSDFTFSSSGPTTALPSDFDLDAVLPELTTPQERYDHGYKRGYMAGYTEGARQAKAERQAELESQKAAWAATQAHATGLLAQLASATDKYLQSYGPREMRLTEEALAAVFDLAEAIVGRELEIRPDRALHVARNALLGLPTGPAIVRVNPADKALLAAGAEELGNGAQQVKVVVDPEVERGGCVVTSGATTVDGRLTAALARAKAAFCQDIGSPARAEASGVPLS